MTATLSDLRPTDRFNIIPFRTELSRWKDGLVEADQITISKAKQYAQRMRANGGTNINAALLEGLWEINEIYDGERARIIFCLTDGSPTEGETDPEKIVWKFMNAKKIRGHLQLDVWRGC